MKKVYYIFILILLFSNLNSCKSSFNKRGELKIIKKELSLTKEEFNSIKSKDSIIKQLNRSISNSIETELINRRLDSFFDYVYDETELIGMLKVDVFFKDDPSFKVERLFDKNITNTLRVDSIQQVRDYYNSFEKNVNNSLKQKDSLN